MRSSVGGFTVLPSGFGLQPDEVLFIDDHAENTSAARDLGMHTITFTSATALARRFSAHEPYICLLQVTVTQPGDGAPAPSSPHNPGQAA